MHVFGLLGLFCDTEEWNTMLLNFNRSAVALVFTLGRPEIFGIMIATVRCSVQGLGLGIFSCHYEQQPEQ